MSIDTPIPIANPMKVLVTFTDDNGVPFDPVSNIQIVVEDPHNVTTTYTYPTNLNKESVGVYSVIVEVNQVGYWSGQGSGNLPNNLTVTTPKVYKKVF